MRIVLYLLYFVLSLTCSGQDLNSVYIPEEWATGCSVLNGVFHLDDNRYCVYGRKGCDFGGGFWAIITSDREVIQFVQEGEANNIVEGYQNGDSLIFAGVWDASDVLSELFSLRIPYHINGERGAHTRIDHVFTIDNGLAFDPVSEREWFATQHRVCEIKKGRADTILRLNYQDVIQSVDAYDGILYAAHSDTIWVMDSNGDLSFIYNIPNIRSLRFDSSGGIYVLGVKWLYHADSVGAPLKVIQNFNEERGTPFSLLLGDDGHRGQRATLVYTSSKTNDENEGTGVFFDKGEAMDTLNWTHPSYQLYGGIYTAEGVLGFGIQRALGTMFKAGVLLTQGDITPSTIDLAIGMHIDTSYWKYDTTPRPSVVKTHIWDYTVTLTNLGSDTVHFGDVFSPTAFSAWFFEFREYCGFKEDIPPGDSIHMQCQGQGHLYNVEVGQQCMAVDAIDTYLDRDYSNNIACAAIPRPIGVWTSQITPKPFTVTPNPSNGHINMDLPFEGGYDFKVVDLTGSILLEAHSHSTVHDLSSLKPGVYNILITTSGDRYQTTVVKAP